jgi:hypothetical protein
MKKTSIVIAEADLPDSELRVMVGWTLDLFFARDIEQMITLRDVEALGDMARRIRTRRTQLTPNAAASTPEAGIQLK